MAEEIIHVIIRMPGKFDAFFSGTGIAEGQYNESNPIEVLVRQAYVNSARRGSGKNGYYLVLFLEGDTCMVRSALDDLMSYATTCKEIKRYSSNEHGEYLAALSFIKHLQAAHKEIALWMTADT